MIPVQIKLQAEFQRLKQRKFHSPVAKKPLKPAHSFNPAALHSLSTSFNIHHDYSQKVLTYSAAKKSSGDWHNWLLFPYTLTAQIR